MVVVPEQVTVVPDAGVPGPGPAAGAQAAHAPEPTVDAAAKTAATAVVLSHAFRVRVHGGESDVETKSRRLWPALVVNLTLPT